MSLNISPDPAARARVDAEWWRGAAIYQIYPRSFADSNDDGVGDLPGITARLDYVRGLGVDAVWLSPFFTSPMKDFGYDIADYCGVDPIFGTLADFDALIARAHALGLKVIIDQVYSHTSDQHPWFVESRASRESAKADWYVWADAKPDGAPPNNWQSVFGGPAWTWDARRRQYYLHNFLSAQPDLNLHNPGVKAALFDVARFWFERGVDGFRLDAINFSMHDTALRDNPPAPPGKRTRPFDFQEHIYNQSHEDIPAFLDELRQLALSYGDRFLVAEVGGAHSDREMKIYTKPPERLQSAYGFDFLYADRLTPALVRDCAARWADDPNVGWPSWAFSNHDAPRAISRWAEARDQKALAKLTLLLLAAMRGSIFIYQGEELGLPQAHVPFERLRDPEAIANWPQTLGRDGARTPMPWTAVAPNAGFSRAEPWLPVDPAHIALAVDKQESDAGSVLHFARHVIGLRHSFEALRTGGMMMHDAPEPLLVFERGKGREAVLCVFNLGAADVAWRLPPGWRAIEWLNVAEGANTLPALSAILAQHV
ncbi:MAG: alpha-amylase family glycosyl hydrolase [Terricaulis silvestris]